MHKPRAQSRTPGPRAGDGIRKRWWPTRGWPALALVLAGCGDGGNGPAARAPSEPPPLLAVLPAASRGILAVDVGLLRAEPSAVAARLIQGRTTDPALDLLFETIRRLVPIDGLASIDRLLLAQTVHAADGFLLVAYGNGAELAERIGGGKDAAADVYHGHPLHVAGPSGLRFALPRDGLLVAGSESGVRAAIDTLEGDAPAANAGALGPYLEAVGSDRPLAFVYGLPALYRDVESPGPGTATLRRARVASGELFFDGDGLAGRFRFHADDAESYVARFNDLVADTETPRLGVPAPGVVELEVPHISADPTPEGMRRSRSLLKKLTHDMDAVDYADGVRHGGNVPWMNFDVGGEPNSIFLNFEFADQASIDDFEENELPEGFELVPIRILDTDEPTYFLVLNVYDSSGGLVSGARAEWSVFVKDPEDGHPRFLVVQAVAASISADPVNLLTAPEPVSHELEGRSIVSRVGVADPDGEGVANYFTAAVAWPQAVEERVAFAREFVAANDFIYWGNGVADRTLYNASVHNREGVRIADADLEIQDDSRWSRYLRPRPKHGYVYRNPLEIVISPWWNLDADYLDVTPDHRQKLVDFKDGFYPATVRGIAEKAVAGSGEALGAYTVGASVPSVYFNFEIPDPRRLAEVLQLPEGTSLAELRILEGEAEAKHYLSLRVEAVDGAPEGKRAEWTVYVQGADGRPHALVVELLTEDAGVDPVRLLQLPDVVELEVGGGRLEIRLESDPLDFEASAVLHDAVEAAVSLPWVEAGDWVCRPGGICDKIFYDGATMEAPVVVASRHAVDIRRFRSSWSDLVTREPASVFVRSGARQHAWNPWKNVGE